MVFRRRQSSSATPDTGRQSRIQGEDFREVLAVIDFCVARKLRGHKFEQTVIDTLDRTLQKRFTWEQIDGKVGQFWKFNAVCDNGSNHSCIYELGTETLDLAKWNLTAKAAINSRTKQLLIDIAERQHKPARGRRGRKRRQKKKQILESAARNENDSMEREESVAVEPPFQNAPESAIQDSEDDELSPPPDSIPDDYQPTERDATPFGQSQSQPSERLSSQAPSSEDSEMEDISSRDSSVINIKCEISQDPSERLSISSGARTPASIQFEAPETDSLCQVPECASTRRLLVNREQDVRYFHLECTQAKSNVERLEAELQGQKNSNIALVNSFIEPMKEHLGEKLGSYFREVEIVQSKVDNKEALTPFTTRSSKKYIPFEPHYFEEHMKTIENGIEDFMSCAEASRPCKNFDFEKQKSELRDLLQRVKGNSVGELRNISFHALLRSLLSAAVCEWVFECALEETVLASSPLSQAIMNTLALQDGGIVARNVEFAAHHVIFEGHYFQHQVIPRRAEDLASRISTTLEPLLELQRPLSKWSSDSLQIWKGTSSALERIFTAALKIKIKALVSLEVFEVNFPAQGSRCDGNHMKIDDLERQTKRQPTPLPSEVRICLVPGLRKFPGNRKRIDDISFRRPGSNPEEAFDWEIRPTVIV